MKKNNLFQYATKELSQDAMICWLINHINYPESSMYPLGVAVLDLFLGDKKQKEYYNVQVIRQYKKIDVLVLFNDTYALIIEDKTNTTEHGEQVTRYKMVLETEYPEKTIFTAYIKTGIMYDADVYMLKKTDVVIGLNEWTNVLSKHLKAGKSEILEDYVEYLNSRIQYYKEIDEQLDNGNYRSALSTDYGQFSFLDRIFCERSKGTEIGRIYAQAEKNPAIYIERIYKGANPDGTPWTQYYIWGEKYPVQIKQANELEYHYLFWRIDGGIALRHYDKNAGTKAAENFRERKQEAYFKFKKIADRIYDEYYTNADAPKLYDKVGKKEKFKESTLLFIPVENLKHLRFEEVKELLLNITKEFMI